MIAGAARRLGPRNLTLVAAVAATASTFGYGLVRGMTGMLLLRIIWGLAFGALSLTTIAYSVTDVARAGRRLGASRAFSAIGPLIALTLGPFIAAQWSTPVAFLAFGALTALAIPIAAALPGRVAGHARVPRGSARSHWGFLTRRTPLNWWSFGIGFAVDGVFAVGFAPLVAPSLPAGAVLGATGMLLATRYVAEIAFAPLAGRFGDRVGARRPLVLCTVFVCAGFAMIGAGAATGSFVLWLGAAIVVVARGLLTPLGPALLAATAQSSDADAHPYRAQSDFAAWRDAGAALGPLVAG